MAVKMSYSGASELGEMLSRLGTEAPDIARKALFTGAGTVADAVKAAVMQLPVGTPKENSPTGHPFTGLTEEDRDDLAAGVGIARFDSKGDAETTAISFNGYTRRTEPGFPKGVPLAMIARSLESGSSVRAKHPFVRQTIRAVKDAAQAAMVQTAEAEISKITEGKK